MSSFRVKPGQKISIDIEGDASAETGNSESEAESRYVGAEAADVEQYAFRRVPKIEFYDLGTRLQSVPPATDLIDMTRVRAMSATDSPERTEGWVNEYLEIGFDAEVSEISDVQTQPEGVYDPYSFASQHLQAVLPGSVQLEFDRLCLGSRAPESEDTLDPFGRTKANDSERMLAHCMPLWAGSDDQVRLAEDYHLSAGYPNEIFDLILYNADGEDILPNAYVRERVRDIRFAHADTRPEWASMDIRENPHWKKRESKDSDGTEHWNPRNVDQGDAFEAAHDSLKELTSSYQVKIDSRLIYEPFDTGDPNYKVTREPEFTAEEVSFRLKTGRKAARIFLKPQWLVAGRHFDWTHSRNLVWDTYFYGDIITEPPFGIGEPYDHLDLETEEPVYSTFGGGFQTTASLILGMHACRWPVMPRSRGSLWDSMLTYNGYNSYSFSDLLDGVTYLYDHDIAAAKEGRTVGFSDNVSRVKENALYNRHESKDRHFYIYQVRNADALAATARKTLTLTEARDIKSTRTISGVLLDPATALATLTDQGNDGVLVDILNGLEAAPKIQNVTDNSSTEAILDDDESVYFIPPTSSPAGTLCGVIEQNGSCYYVWRKIAQPRGVFDYDRDQGFMPI